VGRRVADQAGQVFLGVPAHVVDQPAHLGGKLHVALDAHAGPLAAQRVLQQIQRRAVGHGQEQVGLGHRRALAQAGRRGRQRIENATAA
jgi:hypothetical protein